MNKFFVSTLSIAFFILTLSIESQAFQKKGFIYNNNGEKCWYSQIEEKKSNYFYEKITSELCTLEFEKKDCMLAISDSVEETVNVKMINNAVSRWYSHPDADFATDYEELLSNDEFGWLVKGECIQSRKYPTGGIAIDYLVENDNITKVFHAGTVDGCSDSEQDQQNQDAKSLAKKNVLKQKK